MVHSPLHPQQFRWRSAFLVLVGIANCKAVRAANIVTLLVLGPRIVDLKEKPQDLATRNPLRVEPDLDPFCMVAMVAIRGVGDVSAGLVHAGRLNAWQLEDQVLHAPKSNRQPALRAV